MAGGEPPCALGAATAGAGAHNSCQVGGAPHRAASTSASGLQGLQGLRTVWGIQSPWRVSQIFSPQEEESLGGVEGTHDQQ